MKNLLHLLVIFLISLISYSFLPAQTIFTTTPNVSPKAKVLQRIGTTDVKVIYYRPSVNGREVWGSLVPYDQVWRAGANDNTVIYFSTDVEIEGQPLKAGTYGLHIFPTKEDWTVIFSNNSTSWGSFSYNPKEDALRVKTKPVKTDHHVEQLTYQFENVSPEGGTCVLAWEKVRIPFSISVDVHEQVLANIRNELRSKAGWTWRGWNEAAAYCLQNNTNLKEGMTWAQRSVFMNPNIGNMLTKARLAAAMKGEKAETNNVILASLEKDLKANSVTWKEYHGAAQFCMNQKINDERGMKWIDQSIAMNANMTNMMAKVNMLKGQNKTKEAEKLTKEAVSKGTNAELNNYGYQLLLGGKAKEAVEVFEANAEKHPEDPNVWDSLGEGYFNIGNHEKAIGAFKKSLSLNPPANVKANSIKLLKQMGVDYENMKP